MTSPKCSLPETETAWKKIAEALKTDILNGKYTEGERLPTERELADIHGVSRPVIREALNRLQTRGLIQTKKSSGSYVTNFSLHGGLELLEDILSSRDPHVDPHLNQDLLMEILEFYFHLIKGAVRLAAVHANDRDIEAIKSLSRARVNECHDIDKLIETNTLFFVKIAEASKNRLYQYTFNSLGRILARIRKQVPLETINPEKQQPYMEKIIEAIENRDPDLAILFYDRLVDYLKTLLSEFLASR